MPFLRDRLLGTDMRGIGVMVAVAASMVMGGSDVLIPWLDLAVQLTTLCIATWWFLSAPRAKIAMIPRTAWVACAVVLALPLMQLIPLPPSIWHGLPGRDLERGALALIGQDNSWRPLSMLPRTTLATMLSLCSSVILIPMVASSDRGGRSRIVATIAAVGLLSMLVGTQQVVGGSGSPLQFFQSDSHALSGFQRSRNGEADILLIAMLATACCAVELLRLTGMERRRRTVLALAGVLTLVFAVGVILTGSRTGLLLLLPTLLAQGMMLRPQLKGRLGLILLPVVVIVLGVTALAVQDVPAVHDALAHYQSGLDTRPAIWRKTAELVPIYGVTGVGLGVYPAIYGTVEQMDTINAFYVAHAFNDYAQLIIDAGIPGALVLAAMAIVILRGVAAGLLNPVLSSRAHYLFALATLGLLATHSFWDYPLRSPSLACIAACCVGMLLPARQRSGSREEQA